MYIENKENKHDLKLKMNTRKKICLEHLTCLNFSGVRNNYRILNCPTSNQYLFEIRDLESIKNINYLIKFVYNFNFLSKCYNRHKDIKKIFVYVMQVILATIVIIIPIREKGNQIAKKTYSITVVFR